VTLRRKCTGAKHTAEAVENTSGVLVGERSKGGEGRSQGRLERLEVRMPV